MAIPTLDKWKSKTFSVGSRSPGMALIDDQLRAYWQANDREGQNATAYGIRKACRHWLEAHQNHIYKSKVQDLKGEAEQHLSQYQVGWTQFAASKDQGKSANLKALAPGYHHERRMYEAGGKQSNPISASVLRDAALADAPPNTDPRQLMTQLDDVTWDGYARAGGPIESMGATNTVLFFDKRERLEHMLLPLGGKLVWAKNNQLFTSPANQPYMYAMDGYGNVFARSDQLGATQFNHSSFNAGREVICAGMIAATSGELDFISNDSGHYQPTRADLYSCVKKLIDNGVKMVFGINGAQGTTRVRAMGLGDWPGKHYGNVPGFDQIAAALYGAAPTALVNPPTYARY